MSIVRKELKFNAKFLRNSNSSKIIDKCSLIILPFSLLRNTPQTGEFDKAIISSYRTNNSMVSYQSLSGFLFSLQSTCIIENYENIQYIILSCGFVILQTKIRLIFMKFTIASYTALLS